MNKVTNISKDDRRFRDMNTGKDVIVAPNKFVITNASPEQKDIWKVEKYDQNKNTKIGD